MTTSMHRAGTAVLFAVALFSLSVASAANLGDIINQVAHAIPGPDHHNVHSPMRVNDGSGEPFGLHELEQSTLHNIMGNQGGNFLQNLTGHGGGGFMNELATAGAIYEAGHVANEVLHEAAPIVESLTHNSYPQQQNNYGGYRPSFGGGYPGGYDRNGQPMHPYSVQEPHYEPHYAPQYENPYQNPYQGNW